jgi:hypothetical protein
MSRDRALAEARAIRRAISSGSLEELNSSTAASLLLIDLSAERCAGPQGQFLWRRAIAHLSDLTSTYLSSSELEGIWQSVVASPCYRAVAGEHRTWADLFVAVSRRDAREIVTIGTRLLESPAPLSTDERAYLTTLIAAADVGLGQPAEAANLLQAKVSLIGEPGRFSLPLQELMAMTRSSTTEAPRLTSR